MNIKEIILAQLKEAMKGGDKKRVTILRTLHAAIKQVEIDTQKDLTNEEVQQVVQRQVKQLQDAVKDFTAGGRTDLVEENMKEINILSTFLPEQLSDEALNTIIEQVVTDNGKDLPFGQLMGAVMKQVAGEADGNRVRTLLDTYLKS